MIEEIIELCPNIYFEYIILFLVAIGLITLFYLIGKLIKRLFRKKPKEKDKEEIPQVVKKEKPKLSDEELKEIHNKVEKEEKNNMAYTEINPELWTYEKEGDFIEGVLVSKDSEVGENKSWMYNIETSEGVRNVWGSAILDSRMKFVKVGDKIKITYKGLGESKAGRNAPKIFRVEVDVA